MQRVLFVGVGCAIVLSLAVLVEASRQSALSAADGQRLLDKLVEISSRDGTESGAPVVIHQREVNGYLHFQAVPDLPAGVSETDVALRNGGSVSVRATVDLSAIREARDRGALDPLRYLSGRLPVTADGSVRSHSGVGHVEVESVSIGGIPMPSSVFAELVRYHSRSQQYPDGIDVNEPFDLPYGVIELRVEHERVVVVQ